MTVAASESALLQAGAAGLWWLNGWAPGGIRAAVTDRRMDRTALEQQWLSSTRLIEAEQVHGASLAVIQGSAAIPAPIAGCDALMTDVPGTALLIRTADCLPIFIADPVRRAVGLAHAGWRGLAAQLPLRLLAAFRDVYHSRPEDLRAAIGPAIRPCCYDVGEEFRARFGRRVRQTQGRYTCDLIGVAMDQLHAGGLRPQRVTDSGACTACDRSRWFSLRREGPSTGRLMSLIGVDA